MPLEQLDHFTTLEKELGRWSICLRCSNELDIGLRSAEPFWSFGFFDLLQCSCFSCTVRLTRQSISNPSTLLCTCSACRLYCILHRSCLWHPTSTTSMPLLFFKDESLLHCVKSSSNLICSSIFYSFFPQPPSASHSFWIWVCKVPASVNVSAVSATALENHLSCTCILQSKYSAWFIMSDSQFFPRPFRATVPDSACLD